jgi:maltose alpha-D-glucosyltransferase/alpha-amylase
MRGSDVNHPQALIYYFDRRPKGEQSRNTTPWIPAFAGMTVSRMPEQKPTTPLPDDPLWYKDAIIYELHIKAFYDSNGDGIGDLPGLIQKLDYIHDLGVNCVWLLPFYPSPLKDDGYDIADYNHVHPDYGTRKDFATFVREAHRRGLRVITELVINHTSDQHPWFQAARRAPRGSSKRDFYVWSDTVKKYEGTRIIFTDTEISNWTWDPAAKQYYWHRFFSHQPDLNFDNPQVVKAVMRVMRFWLETGVDGLRLDAIPYLVEREGTSSENLPETHVLLKQLRAELDRRFKNRMFLAEANQWPEDVRDYFGEGDECHVAYHFPLMPRIYMAIAQEDRHPIVEIMQQTPDIPENCQWAIFLRNHDELTLEMVTSKERDYMYQMYAADPRSRINLGIRRRLGPLMENDGDRIKLMNSLLLSMPGTPIIYYGDEIGMGDNIYLGDRNGVRTPMQWTPDRNGGFSRADPQRLFLPPIMDPIYGYEAVNVEAQLRDPYSLLNWMRRVLAVRKGSKAFGRGTLTFLRPGNRKVLAYLRELDDEAILCVANLARAAQPVELDLSRFKGRVPVELMGRTVFPPVGELPYLLTLSSHDFYWFRLAKGEEVPSWHEERLPREELPLLVLFDGWSSFMRERVVPWRIAMADKVRAQLEVDALPHFMQAQRWYAAKGTAIKRVALHAHGEWHDNVASWMLALVRIGGEDSDTTEATYFMPLTLVWEDGADERMRGVKPGAIARVRQQSRLGLLADAFCDEHFCRTFVKSIESGRDLPCGNGTIRLRPTRAFEAHPAGDANTLTVHPPGGQSSNTTIVIDDRMFLKGYRRLQAGISCELEIGRFLTEVANFSHIVPVLGWAEYVEGDETTTLALLQTYIDNQGDGWEYTLDYLQRFLSEHTAVATPSAGTPVEAHAGYLSVIQTLGTRTAQLHQALATRSGDPLFEPEQITTKDITAWVHAVKDDAALTFDLLHERQSSLVESARSDADAVLEHRREIVHRIDTAVPIHVEALKIRYHGDYHLGQVLLVQNDFLIIDFEGEPTRSLTERRRKHSPMKDVAGMIRSFNYAMYAAVARATDQRPEDLPAIGPLAQQWEGEVVRAFLDAYAKAGADAGLFASWAEAQGFVQLFLIEKALYELRYELNNRPDWVHIPLRGLLSIGVERTKPG